MSHHNHDDSDAATMSSGKQGERHSARNPACDLCREKKVRCGREKPACQNCITWKTPCTYSERQKRENEASRNAQRFEEVYDRLDRMESTILRLVTALESANLSRPAQQPHNPAPPPPSPPPPPPPPAVVLPPLLKTIPPICQFKQSPSGNPCSIYGISDTCILTTPTTPQRDVQFLGLSSMLSLSIEAGSLAEKTLRQKSVSPGRRSSQGGSADTRIEAMERSIEVSEQAETIGALKKLSSISSSVASWFPHYGHKELRLGAGGASMKVPPREVAETLVSVAFKKVHIWFPIFDEACFRKDMDAFYAGDEKLVKDRAWLVCFNNVMLFGIYNRSTCGDPIYPGSAKDFFLNGWAAIDDAEIMLGPKLRNIQALLTGAVIANEVSRPGLCWSLVAQAARLAQAIGLHRSSSDVGRTKEDVLERRCIFWNIYILDKSLSLSFGRPTCLPDFDCDVELPEDNGTNPYFKNFISLIWLSKIQSKIYIGLYSASALRLTDEERARNITELDGELRRWWEAEKPNFLNADGARADLTKGLDRQMEEPMDVFSKMELRFSYLCSLTLVHRIARPGMRGYALSENICLESARESIRVVNSVIEKNLDIANSGMIMWLFQYYPFTAFFVLFSAVIRNPSAVSSRSVDFPLMKSLVTYLARMKKKNDGAAKLLRVASAFTHVAGTFLKNYGKIEQRRSSSSSGGGGGGGKRRRHEMETDDDDDGGDEADMEIEPEGWLQSGGRDSSRTFVKGFGKGFYGTSAFPRDQVEQVVATNTGSSYDASASAAMSTTSMDEDCFGEVDLHPASFLRWPEHDGGFHMENMTVEESIVGGGGGGGGGAQSVDLDLQALMEEPEGFQIQMEQAVLRGPLEFDWFSWEGFTAT